ncbi:hypothetical protein TcCL_ESM04577 [Trypanosoma cruzi]|nr:hypothetical protein TcCL_ESM04577 [Trypanosoma cruzi]
MTVAGSDDDKQIDRSHRSDGSCCSISSSSSSTSSTHGDDGIPHANGVVRVHQGRSLLSRIFMCHLSLFCVIRYLARLLFSGFAAVRAARDSETYAMQKKKMISHVGTRKTPSEVVGSQPKVFKRSDRSSGSTLTPIQRRQAAVLSLLQQLVGKRGVAFGLIYLYVNFLKKREPKAC